MVAEADFTGSTADMSGYVGDQKPARVVLITECSMSDNVVGAIIRKWTSCGPAISART